MNKRWTFICLTVFSVSLLLVLINFEPLGTIIPKTHELHPFLVNLWVGIISLLICIFIVLGVLILLISSIINGRLKTTWVQASGENKIDTATLIELSKDENKLIITPEQRKSLEKEGVFEILQHNLVKIDERLYRSSTPIMKGQLQTSPLPISQIDYYILTAINENQKNAYDYIRDGKNQDKLHRILTVSNNRLYDEDINKLLSEVLKREINGEKISYRLINFLETMDKEQLEEIYKISKYALSEELIPLDIIDMSNMQTLMQKNIHGMIWNKTEQLLKFKWGEVRKLQELGIIQWSNQFMENKWLAYAESESHRLYIYLKNINVCHIRLTTLGIALNKLLKTTFEPFNSIEFYSTYFSENSIASEYWNKSNPKIKFHELVEIKEVPKDKEERDALDDNYLKKVG